MFFHRAIFQKETLAQRLSVDIDPQTDQDQSDVPVAVVDRSWRGQKDFAQSAAVPVPAASPFV